MSELYFQPLTVRPLAASVVFVNITLKLFHSVEPFVPEVILIVWQHVKPIKKFALPALDFVAWRLKQKSELKNRLFVTTEFESFSSDHHHILVSQNK